MSWFTYTFLRLRAAMGAIGSPTTTTAGPRAIGTAIQTTTRKSLVQQAPKLINQPKVLTCAPRPGNPVNAEYLAWQMGWEKFGEQPSPHQRLAPYA
ncbi:hypothetical protein SLS55_000506 [Diplodia seriata]|uniref:Uncharacterized protein n=1 Tax=Diplodia seriata TaxID=420778 RepID=A0ABR3CUH1_9PEZI